MRKLYISFLISVMISTGISSQPYVQINDPVWSNYLTVNYPTCMSGNTLNGGCGSLNSSSLNLNGMGLTDISGIQYFSNLSFLSVAYNSLSVLPQLPASLSILTANNNSITSIVNFPANCYYIDVRNNQLSSLPPIYSFTPGLALFCGGNNITCFGPFPPNSDSLVLLPNPFTCLPNHVVGAMNATLLATPICSVGNFYNCPSVGAVSGSFYRDMNANCVRDNNDVNITGIGVKLINSSGTVVSQYYSQSSYSYQLCATVGTYTVRVDSSGLPIFPQCPTPGYDSVNIVLSGGNPNASNINFNFTCPTGFDVHCPNVWMQGNVFPGLTHYMRPNVGNAVIFPGLNCVANTTGQVVVSTIGPVVINGPLPGSFTPTILGNTCTYTLSNFNCGWSDFGLSIGTLTSATIGQSVCVTVVVSPTLGDNVPSNNTYTFCYAVGNSFDPNEKHTWPETVLPGYTGWFDYQIHFQNLGNAPAYNIRILDTLDSNLDLSSFKVVSSTDNYNLAINGNIANFVFPNIMLPDSASDPQGSKAMIHYRIKPKPGMVNGSKIKNRAHIYFDFNPAVITNQTMNTFSVVSTGFQEVNSNINALVYPNPVRNNLLMKFSNEESRTLTVFDLIGNEVLKENFNTDHITISTTELSSGVYLLKVKGESGIAAYRVVVDK